MKFLNYRHEKFEMLLCSIVKFSTAFFGKYQLKSLMREKKSRRISNVSLINFIAGNLVLDCPHENYCRISNFGRDA